MKNIIKLIEYPKEGILSKEIIKNEGVDVTLFCMTSSSEISEHASVKAGFVYVLEGDGIFNLEGGNIRMDPGVFIPLKENAVHSLKVKENTSFMLVLNKK